MIWKLRKSTCTDSGGGAAFSENAVPAEKCMEEKPI
jgi:hypothetical protein